MIASILLSASLRAVHRLCFTSTAVYRYSYTAIRIYAAIAHPTSKLEGFGLSGYSTSFRTMSSYLHCIAASSWLLSLSCTPYAGAYRVQSSRSLYFCVPLVAGCYGIIGGSVDFFSLNLLWFAPPSCLV